jgi:hypothetical protein
MYIGIIGAGLALAMLSLSACSDGETNSSVATASPTPSPSAFNAEAIGKALGERGLPIERVTVLDEATDPNNLLGRPGQYTSKIDFFDKRHSEAGSEDGRNTIEVFATPEDAKARRSYVEQVTKGMAFAVQYQELRGSVLMRLDKAMLPSEVNAYRDALSQIVPSD